MNAKQEAEIRAACRMFLKGMADLQEDLVQMVAATTGVDVDAAVEVWASEAAVLDAAVTEELRALGVTATAPNTEGG